MKITFFRKASKYTANNIVFSVPYDLQDKIQKGKYYEVTVRELEPSDIASQTGENKKDPSCRKA